MGNFNSLTVTRKNGDGGDNNEGHDLSNRKPTAEELRNVPAITSQAELHQLMRSREYKDSDLVRELVKASLSRPDSYVGRPGESRREDVLNRVGNITEAKIDAAKRLMRDPRYKTSAQFRFEVAKMIQEQRQGRPATSGNTIRTEFSSDPHQVVEQQGLGGVRVQYDAKTTGMHKPTPVERQPKKPDGTIDLGY